MPTQPRKRLPQPITFPSPKPTPIETAIPHPEPETGRLIPYPRPPISKELRDFIAHCIAKSLYEITQYSYIANVATMNEKEFEDFCKRVLEDDEA